MRDAGSDSRAAFRTLAGLLGPDRSKLYYYALLFLPYLFACAFGSIWPPVFCALSAPLALKLREKAARGDFAPLVPETARLVAVYGLLLSCGLHFAH